MKEFYIYGRPIKTQIGDLHFITVEEYYDFIHEGHLSILVLQKEDLLQRLKEIEKLDSGIKPIISTVEKLTLFEFVRLIGNLDMDGIDDQSYIKLLKIDSLYAGFKKLFEFCFKEDVFDRILSNEEFEEYRKLILEINCIPYEKPNPNPEIERYNQMKRLMQKHKGESADFESMYTSVWVGLSQCPDKLTLYRFNKLFARIAQFKNYNTSTLFATVSNDVKIDMWYKAIEEQEEEKQYITEEQLKLGLQKKL